MAVQNLPVEVNTFVKGLVTEASPLTFPENASLDERNFVLNRDGSRRRRLGINLNSPLSTVPNSPNLLSQSTKVFEWESAGGAPSLVLLVAQLGNNLMFFDTSGSVETYPVFIDSVDVTEHVTLTDAVIEVCDMSSVDGTLVVVLNERDILIVTYDADNNTFSYRKDYLRIRDFFGIQDRYVREGVVLENDATVEDKIFDDLLDDQYSNVRPYLLTDNHLYNLRNQSWGRLRDGLFIQEKESDTDLEKDPISAFVSGFALKEGVIWRSTFVDVTLPSQIEVFPSNADSVSLGIIDYAEKKGAPERFVPIELGDSPRSSSASPKGFFIIDALQRGFSRGEQVRSMLSEGNGQFDYGYFDPYPEDRTPRGASCIAEYAGRVWYSGFSSEVRNGDRRSPKMASYVLYSQLVQDLSNITNCYQKNDPTYELEADLLATDGGYIRLDGAYDIQKMVNLGSSIIIFARNGVWQISGGSDVGFTAEAYIVKKITDQGVAGPNSVVDVGSSAMYWADNGIYLIAPNEFGDFVASNISQEVIQKYYEAIPIEERTGASGIYDKYENKVRWLYSPKGLGGESKELIFDVSLQAFYPSVIAPVDANSPYLLHPVYVSPYQVGTQVDEVAVEGVGVQVIGEDVIINTSVELTGQKETYYLTVWNTSPLQIGFSTYSDSTFTDWSSYNGGVDASAYFITGYGPAGDFQRRKQVPYLTSYMLRTEDGFKEVLGDIVPTSESSCNLQARWEWANSANSNRWGRTFELYRYKRFYMPEDIDDTFDTGQEVVSTKNKLRGHGKTLSLKFSTSPQKDCRLLGWSMIVGVSTSV